MPPDAALEPGRVRRLFALGSQSRPAWLLPAALFLAGLAISGVTILRGIQPNDEGLMLQAARRIAEGEVPYRDFWWFYPPGQPYLLGGLWALFGPSLLAWRVVRLLTDATVALLAWKLARRRAGTWPSLATWAMSILALTWPSFPHPAPLALAFMLGALLLVERRPALAGILVGLCAFWRIEFAAYLALGLLVASVLAPESRRARWHRVGRIALPAVLTALVLYAPVVIAAGVRPSWELLVRYPLLEFSAYQSLPFPVHFTNTVRTVNDAAGMLLPFFLPLVLVVGLAAALLTLAMGFRRERDWAVPATAITAIGMAHYLMVRPDEFHTAPLAVLTAIVAAWAVHRAWDPQTRGSGARRVVTLAAGTLAGVALAYGVIEGTGLRRVVLLEATVPLDLPVADGVRASPETADPLRRAVREVQRHTAPGSAIYVLGRRSDITTASAPLFYVLAERANPTRYDIAAPGVVTSAPVQRAIIERLRASRPGAIVRWNDRVTATPEPNRAGRSSGVRLLDAWIAANYRPAARYDTWVVLLPRSAG